MRLFSFRTVSKLSVLVAVSFSFAGLVQAQDGAVQYYDSLTCTGTVKIPAPADLAASYHQVRLTLTAYKSRKRDGSFADTLQANYIYAATTENLNKPIGRTNIVYFTSPLVFDQETVEVVHPNLGRGVKFGFRPTTITAVYGGKFHDEGPGHLDVPASNVLSVAYSYELSCKGLRIPEPEKIIDNTVRR